MQRCNVGTTEKCEAIDHQIESTRNFLFLVLQWLLKSRGFA